LYITSFVHREALFDLANRWLCAQLHPGDGLLVTKILISDGFVLGETMESLIRDLLGRIHAGPIHLRRIHLKGELREVLCESVTDPDPRSLELIENYRSKPEFYYRDVPINGALALDERGRLLGLYRLKRPRRIAEKANRYIANWIYQTVQSKARRMAEERARVLRIPLELLITPEEEMAREFIQAEESIAKAFKEGTIRMDREALTINDIGGIKIVAEEDRLRRLEESISQDPCIEILEREDHTGDYKARTLILKVRWDREQVSKAFIGKRAWERYVNRGIPVEELQKGIDPWLEDAASDLVVEIILSTMAEMLESELGRCIHEERILLQRDTKVYRGYIPTNVEFLVEYLFSVGLSPKVQVDSLPIVLWGRYLPETMISKIRELYGVGENGPLY
jgi:hypothetical protein